MLITQLSQPTYRILVLLSACTRMRIQLEDTLSEVMSSLPPGFRFHASDEELLLLYLKPKILGQPDEHYSNIIPEIDVCEFEPWQLPAMFHHMFNRKEQFFYCRVKCKYLNSRRSDRTTRAGYWKVTGKERPIMSEDTSEQIGIKKTLVFYEGRVPKGKRTNWVMHEYHLNSKHLGDNHVQGVMLPYVACRIKNKKDKKPMMGHAPTIIPEGYSSSPYTCTSSESDPPGNQEGDLPSFCNTPNNEVADHQGGADAQPEMSVQSLMESLTLDDCVSDFNSPPTYQPQAADYAQPESLEESMKSLPLLEILDYYVSDYINTPTYQPQVGAEAGSSPFFDNGYMPSAWSDFGLDWGNV
ncbi:NAC domain-containing protein 96-like isoform X2 [Syzygium oleosum]|uniref:NAC domain-containing protein 96-like isoform X2 n=1 Tax=Syzygium oleosum TaxID=219896 RepID=UPI0024B9AC1C|nr:NAC domain-containing protein 96-like isoform X2 [Syzygium oleosum]